MNVIIIYQLPTLCVQFPRDLILRWRICDASYLLVCQASKNGTESLVFGLFKAAEQDRRRVISPLTPIQGVEEISISSQRTKMASTTSYKRETLTTTQTSSGIMTYPFCVILCEFFVKTFSFSVHLYNNNIFSLLFKRS